MKYILLMMGLLQMTSLGATQFKSWQEHANYYLKVHSEKQQNGPIDFVTVGSDNACDFRTSNTRIQDAIDDNHQEIRIVTDTYLENLNINDISVSLKGGYANCVDAAADVSDGSQVTVDASGLGSVLSITSSAQKEVVSISNMVFQNGTNGISILNANLELGLSNVWLNFNNGGINSGGGLSVIGGDTDILGTDLLIASNTAWFGGGMLCSGENNSILINKENNFSGISINQAINGDGGGAWITDGCVLSMYAGTNAGFPNLSGITGNSATGHGGGVAVTNGGQANLLGFQFCFGNFCIGNDDEPVNLTANVADSDADDVGNGGGIYASGVDTLVYAITVDVNNNQASNGGGFSVENAALLESYYEKSTCWSIGACNQMIANKANVVGGAIYVSEEAIAKIGPSHIKQNRADFGTAGFVNNSASLSIEGSVISENGDNGSDGFADSRVLMINNNTGVFGTSLAVEYSTIVDNNANAAVIGNIGGIINLLSSIVHETNGIDVYAPSGNTTDIFDCLILHEDATLPTGTAAFISVEDPQFIDRAGGDFHVNASNSSALDFCGDFLTETDYLDLDGSLRGWDDPDVLNFEGPYDIGAYESYDNDIIFKNKFES